MTEHASIDKIEQGSEEWHALRRGKVTSSRIADLMRKGRGGTESTSYQRYLADIIVERMTDLSAARSFKTAAMERGNIVEPRAALAYEFYRGVDTATVSFVDHPTIPMPACRISALTSSGVTHCPHVCCGQENH